MPAGSHGGAVPHRARNADMQPTPVITTHDMSEREPTKRDLASWWKNFKRGNQRREEDKGADLDPQGIFGVPLQQSVKYANVAISLYDNDGKSYIYGYVPIVVAKCGVFLKEKATDIEGIFRLSGSEKRIKELRTAFNSPDRYGKGLDWTGYTVHDAANILRRYFNQLPEPIIPLEFYERFREPIRNHQPQAVGHMDGQSPAVGDFHHELAIKTYQRLITELPPLNRQLLLYILDLLAVFASKSDLNKMTTGNLAAIFQPGILSHPDHAMAPPEYRLSQDVLIFLIENQDHFLIGMQGTAADAQTLKDVESGPPTPSARTSSLAKAKVVGRSGSKASNYSGVRRSVSVSSKHSRGSAAPSPMTPSMPSPHTERSSSSIVQRSNTVPSKRGSAPAVRKAHGERTPESQPSGAVTPTASVVPMVISQIPQTKPEPIYLTSPAPPQVILPSPDEATTPVLSPAQSQLGQNTEASVDVGSRVSTEPSRSTQIDPPATTPKTPVFSNFLSASKAQTTERGEPRKPNKLQKKRVPSTMIPSARSSQNSLPGVTDVPAEDRQSPLPSPGLQPSELSVAKGPQHERKEFLQPGEGQPVASPALIGLNTVTSAPRSPSATHSVSSRTGPRPDMSPANSLRSYSTATGDELDRHPVPLDIPPLSAIDRELLETTAEKEKEKRRRWFSRGRAGSGSQGGILVPSDSSPSVGLSDPARGSRSSIASGTGNPGVASLTSTEETAGNALAAGMASQQTPATGNTRKSMNLDRSGGTNLSQSSHEQDQERDKKNPIRWIQGKLAERAEKKEEKDRLREMERAKSPPADQFRFTGDPKLAAQAATANLTVAAGSSSTEDRLGRGKSLDMVRNAIGMGDRGKSMDVPRQSGAAAKEKELERYREEHKERARGRERSVDATRAAQVSNTSAAQPPPPPPPVPSVPIVIAEAERRQQGLGERAASRAATAARERDVAVLPTSVPDSHISAATTASRAARERDVPPSASVADSYTSAAATASRAARERDVPTSASVADSHISAATTASRAARERDVMPPVQTGSQISAAATASRAARERDLASSTQATPHISAATMASRAAINPVLPGSRDPTAPTTLSSPTTTGPSLSQSTVAQPIVSAMGSSPANAPTPQATIRPDLVTNPSATDPGIHDGITNTVSPSDTVDSGTSNNPEANA